MILTACLCLSMLESMLPIPSPVPGVKLGLANVLVMFVCFNIGIRQALLVVILKSIFVLLTRGLLAGLLSASGGLAALIVLVLLLHFNKSMGVVGMSISAAITHNLAQFVLVCWILGSVWMIYLLPILFLSGVFMGSITAVIHMGCNPVLARVMRRTVPSWYKN